MTIFFTDLNHLSLVKMIQFFVTIFRLHLYSIYLKIKTLSKNIKIVSSQTDLPVTKKIFETKPTCVSKWFSVNVEHKSDDLIAIPLGIGNNFSEKNT